MKEKPITAGELMAQLNADPLWAKEKAQRDAYWEEQRLRFAKEQRPLLEELRIAGFDVPSIDAMVKRKEPYPKAIPILLKHLPLSYSNQIREMIARSLAVPSAAYAHDQLVTLLKREIKVEPEKKIRGVVQGLACAVAESTTEENISSLVALVQDETLGDDRVLFLRRLKRSKRPEAKEVLNNLGTDPVFAREIGSWRRRNKTA